MTKIELNNKLAELYNIDNCTYMGDRINTYLIDDWSRLMDLAVDNKLSIHINKNDVVCVHKSYVIMAEFFDEHESPQAATRFAIAMALVKLAEDKP